MEAEQEVLRAAWLKSSASGILVRRNILGVHAYASAVLPTGRGRATDGISSEYIPLEEY